MSQRLLSCLSILTTGKNGLLYDAKLKSMIQSKCSQIIFYICYFQSTIKKLLDYNFAILCFLQNNSLESLEILSKP